MNNKSGFSATKGEGGNPAPTPGIAGPVPRPPKTDAPEPSTSYFMHEIAYWKNRALAAEIPKKDTEFAVEKARYMQQAALQVRKLAVENHTLKEDVRRLYVQLEQLESGMLFDQLCQAEARIFQLESVIEEQQSVVDQLAQSEV